MVLLVIWLVSNFCVWVKVGFILVFIVFFIWMKIKLRLILLICFCLVLSCVIVILKVGRSGFRLWSFV